MLPRFRLLLLLLGLLSAGCSGAQSTAPGGGVAVVSVGVLPDRGYAWPRVGTDAALVFGPADSLRPAEARRYWLRLRLHNPSRYTQAVRLQVRPSLDNTYFYFEEDARAWRTRQAGIQVATDRQLVKGWLPLRLPGPGPTTVYVHLDLGQLAALPTAARLSVTLQPEAAARRLEQELGLAWAVSLTVLGLLLLINSVAYFRSRDRAILYYLCAQIGGVLYITAYRGFFRVLLPNPVFSIQVLSTGSGYFYTPNNLLMHLSVGLLLLGLTQMTRCYLRTPVHLPRLDAALRYALGGYLVFSVVVASVNLGGYYLENDTLRFDNVLVLGLTGLLMATALVADRRRLPAARTFLLATLLPMLLMLAVAGYHVLLEFNNDGRLLLPDLVIVSHALCFSAAIGARLQLLQTTLLAQEREAAALVLDIRQQQLRHREIVLQNQHIQAALQRQQQAHEQQQLAQQQLSADHRQQQSANHELQQQLEANQRELASTTLYVEQKNALLAELKQRIQDLGAPTPELAGIRSLLKTSLYLDEDWGRFRVHFEQVHPRFFEELEARYPTLTKNEQRLYSYFHIHLATKEIAALLNIDPASVRRAKTRLYKKMAAADLAAGRTPAAPTAE